MGFKTLRSKWVDGLLLYLTNGVYLCYVYRLIDCGFSLKLLVSIHKATVYNCHASSGIADQLSVDFIHN